MGERKGVVDIPARALINGRAVFRKYSNRVFVHEFIMHVMAAAVVVATMMMMTMIVIVVKRRRI